MSKEDLINKIVDMTLEQGPPSEVGGKVGNKDCPEGHHWCERREKCVPDTESKSGQMEEMFAMDTPENKEIEKQVDLLVDNAVENEPAAVPEEELQRVHSDIAGYGNPEDEEKEYPPGPQDPDDLGDYPEEPMEEPMAQQLENILGEKGDYQVFFKRMMDKEGSASIKDLTSDKKKSFFNKVDAAWKSKAEKKEEIKEDYKSFFRSLMDKEGITGIAKLSPDQKRSFFNKVSAGWKKEKGSTVTEDFASAAVFYKSVWKAEK